AGQWYSTFRKICTTMTKFAIGVDLGGTNLRIAAVDEHGQLLDKVTTDTNVGRGRDLVITEMCAAITDLTAKLKDAGTIVGVGVGGGLVLHGRIWHGMNGMAGEFGHVTVDPNGPRCKCGSFGCAEVFASATAVVRMANETIAGGNAPQLSRLEKSDPEFSAK